MASPAAPLLLSATLRNLEVTGVPRNWEQRARKYYFARIFVDDREKIVSLLESPSPKSGLKWQWDANNQFWFEPSSSIRVELYRTFKYRTFKELNKLAAKYEGKMVDLLVNDASVTLNDDKGNNVQGIQAKLQLSRVSGPESQFKHFMAKVDADVSRLESGDKVSRAVLVFGGVLQSAKKLMDMLNLDQNAPSGLGVAFSIFSALYSAVEDKDLQDQSIADLARTLREMLGTANSVPDLLEIPDTTNVLEEISRQSLTVASLIQEYTRMSSLGRTAAIQVSDNLKSRIQDCQMACVSLKEKFDRRLAMDTNALARNTYKLVYASYENGLADKVQNWLSPSDSSGRRNEVYGQWQAGTCSWFLEHKQFVDWKERPGILWVEGKAGSGKSVLCSTVIDHLSSEDPQLQLAYFFFDGRDSQTDLQLYRKLLQSLIFQLAFMQDDKLPVPLLDLYKKYKTQQPVDQELEAVLKAILVGLSHTYIIIDALDECQDYKKALGWLQKLSNDGFEELATHILVTSRPVTNLDGFHGLDITKLNTGEEPTNRDIHNYIQRAWVLQPTQYDLGIQEEIQLALEQNPEGSFRWAALQLAAIQACANNSEIRKILKTLPDGLSATYQRIIENIDKHHLPDIRVFLQFLVFSQRPLSITELAEAITVDMETENFPVFNKDRRYHDPQSILQRCSGLVTDSEGVIKLSHFSVKEYILEENVLDIREENSHSTITNISLGYLLQFTSASQTKLAMTAMAPLAEYAAQYWVDHAKLAASNGCPGSSVAIQHLFTKGTIFANWTLLWDIDSAEIYQSTKGSAIYYASMIGFKDLFLFLANQDADLNAQGGKLGNALQAASAGGYKDIVELLLDRGADINAQGGYYENALQAASATGHEDIVKLLIARGADISLGDAVYVASMEGHESITRLLIKKGADVNAWTGGEFGTALHAAIAAGHEAIAMLLIESGAYINVQGGFWGIYENALDAAVANGLKNAVEFLIDKGADINAESKDHETALCLAARGDKAMVELLIKKGANVNRQTEESQTALWRAAAGGYKDIVELLIEKGADINAQLERDFGTALQAAIGNDHEDIARLLIEIGADINGIGGGMTALSAASYRGNETIFMLLIDKGADVNAQGGTYGTAIQTASAEGYENIVKLLVKKGADVNAQGGIYGNALQAAAVFGHEGIVKYLIDNGADIDEKLGECADVIAAAAARGHEASEKFNNQCEDGE